jgi:hypothetical protein
MQRNSGLVSFVLTLAAIVVAIAFTFTPHTAGANEQVFETGPFELLQEPIWGYQDFKSFNFDAPAGTATLHVTHRVGHKHDAGCNEGPGNDNGRFPCDQEDQIFEATRYWLNGFLVLTTQDVGTDTQEEYSIAVTLRPGSNELKVEHVLKGQSERRGHPNSVNDEAQIKWMTATASPTTPPTDVPPSKTPETPSPTTPPTETPEPTPTNRCPAQTYIVTGAAQSTCDEEASAVQLTYHAFNKRDNSTQDGMRYNKATGRPDPFWDTGYARQAIPVPAGWSPESARDALYALAESEGRPHLYYTEATFSETTGLLTTRLTWTIFKKVFGGGEFAQIWLEVIDPNRVGCPEWILVTASAHWFNCPEPQSEPSPTPNTPPSPTTQSAPCALTQEVIDKTVESFVRVYGEAGRSYVRVPKGANYMEVLNPKTKTWNALPACLPTTSGEIDEYEAWWLLYSKYLIAFAITVLLIGMSTRLALAFLPIK